MSWLEAVLDRDLPALSSLVATDALKTPRTYQGLHEKHIALLEKIRPPDWKINCTTLMQVAAWHGDIAILDFLFRNGLWWTKWAVAFAARNGQLATLEWLLDMKAPWNHTVFEYAALGGDLPTVQFLTSKLLNYSWTYQNLTYAAYRNAFLVDSYEIVTHFHKFRDFPSCSGWAMTHSNFDMLVWALEHMSDPLTGIFENIMRWCTVEQLDYLHRILKIPWSGFYMLYDAVPNHPDMFRYMWEHGAPIVSPWVLHEPWLHVESLEDLFTRLQPYTGLSGMLRLVEAECGKEWLFSELLDRIKLPGRNCAECTGCVQYGINIKGTNLL
jgi:hypothetical protein